MKPGGWLRWGKWVFIGCSLLAIVITAASGDGVHKTNTLRVGLPEPRTKSAAQHAPVGSRVELERLDRVALQQNKEGEVGNVGNVFGATSWYVPPPPPPPPPPPKPTAPPMPFTYLGIYEESAGKVIMLAKGDRVYTVSVGDVIENTYRVDGVEHGIVEMTYLPLNIKQSIITGNPS